jgi:hypothetical protein
VRQWSSFLALRTDVRAWRRCEPCHHLLLVSGRGGVKGGSVLDDAEGERRQKFPELAAPPHAALAVGCVCVFSEGE